MCTLNYILSHMPANASLKIILVFLSSELVAVKTALQLQLIIIIVDESIQSVKCEKVFPKTQDDRISGC